MMLDDGTGIVWRKPGRAHSQSVQRLWQRRMILARRLLGSRGDMGLLRLSYPLGALLRSAMQTEITDAGQVLPRSQ
jgi:hypothetical protein